ncbi:glutamine amidotransferase [Erythrobacter sp. NE805]|uniref:glutamine amidotransferase n=1 Tax=Erythrobacter sp. NE805 TaxID=3389875 RepID=UPI00396B1332
MKRALVIRHVPREGLAGFRAPIERAGYVVDRIDVTAANFAEVDLGEPDLLVMLGAPFAVYDQADRPWIACQLRRLKRRLDADLPTLGVCFGAQMIAAALGARVHAGHAKEVGFAPIALHRPALASPLRHFEGVPLLHWHGDTFTLPEGVELLASSATYRHQAFRRGANLLALQFHAEMGEDERIFDWAEQMHGDLAEAGQDRAALLRDYETLGPAAVAAGQAALTEWLAGLDLAKLAAARARRSFPPPPVISVLSVRCP